MENYSFFKTESLLEASINIDKMTPLEIAKIINDQDKTVAYAVEKALPEIAEGIELAAKCLKNNGRILYCGAGTSGRLGILDASECPPTFGVSAETVQGLIAGGKEAAYSSIEDAEDSDDSLVSQMKEKAFSSKDICVGISASGSAKCVQSALIYAKSLGSGTIAVTNNPDSSLIRLADVAVVAVVGPEVISGSTRMKAGTAQKMIINMLSTGAMIKYGRTLGNRMAFMKPSNKKLVARAVNMISAETGCGGEEAYDALKKFNYSAAEAIDYIKMQ
ncbi:MAG: N-acetylmuramic acid 6-phosphate etherase [Eubacteriales bacterium]|nr:N-acetylmuramic acid 6-phosphate etherase [Eubacteriales bacterium]